MKKLLTLAFLASCLASCNNVNKCPVGPYKTHEWVMESYTEGHCIERCTYCDRHRRNWYNSDTYDYENMKTGDLNVKVPKNKVSR